MNKQLAERLAARLQAMRHKIQAEDLSGLYITHDANVAYLIGGSGRDCALWITRDEAFLMTDFRYLEMALDRKELFTYQEIKVGADAVHFFAQRKDERIGVEQQHLSVAEFERLSDSLGRERLVLTADLVESLRAVKDEQEIEATRRACEIADACFAHMCDVLAPGMTEREAAIEIEFFMKKNGAEDLSFDTICVSGVNTSRPHGIPGEKPIETGDFVTLDFGCKVDGYCSDMTRTVAIGRATEEMKNIYHLVLAAQVTACEGIRAGMSCEAADRLARDVIDKAGYGEYFGHGLGHGTGLEIHEAPRLRPGYEGDLAENNIVSIEPGIYLPGQFGVRIEDLALVKPFGIINLTSSPKELLIV